VTLGRAYAKLKLRCVARDSNCKGSVSLKTRTARLGSARFKIASGKSATVKVKLKRSARKRLAHLSRKRLAKLKVIAIAKIGKETTRFTLGAKR
jgi:CxxC motif-containing protein